MEELSPWLSIWVKPKATIGRIVAENPDRSLWALCSIYGFSSLLNLFQSLSLGMFLAPLPLYMLAAILSPFWGYAIFAVWSWLVYLVGSMLKGLASFKQVRAAYAWSCVPLVFNIPLWILLGVLFGEQVFLNFPDGHLFTDAQVLILFGVLVVKVTAAIWSLVIYFNALAQVEQFSILRSIGSIILAGIIVSIAMTLAWMLLLNFVGTTA